MSVDCAAYTPLRLPYRPLPWQAVIKRNRHRFDVIAAGRRSGKTVFGADDLTIGSATVPNSVNWYVGPSYGAAKDAAWDIFKANFNDFWKYGLVTKIVESDLLIRLANGSCVQLKGGDKPDSLRGVRLSRLVIDEYAVMKPEVWDEVLQPATSDLQAPVIFISTPKGFNHFHDLYEMGAKNGGDWHSWHIKASEAGTIPPAEIDRARRDMDPRVFRQEYEAAFESFGGQVFTDFDRSKHVAPEPFGFASGQEYVIGMDFGWSAPTVAVFANIDAKENVSFFAELGRRETPIPQVGLEIKQAVPNVRPSLIGCDPAGAAKSESMGFDCVTELRQIFGFETVRYRANYAGIIQDGVNSIRKWLRNGKLRISPSCTNLIRAFESYRYPDPKDGVSSELPLKDGIADHWIDAVRYLFLCRFPLRSSTVGVL